MTVKAAAERLGCSVVFLRMALRQNMFPFGGAVKYPGSSRWTYYINRERLEHYLKEERQ